MYNVPRVCFHVELPIIITGSKDGTICNWHAIMHRLENILNNGLERIWMINTSSSKRGAFFISVFNLIEKILVCWRNLLWEPYCSLHTLERHIWGDIGVVLFERYMFNNSSKRGKVPHVLIFAGLDSGSGTEIQADMKVCGSLGVHCFTLIIDVTVQNTIGVQGVNLMPDVLLHMKSRDPCYLAWKSIFYFWRQKWNLMLRIFCS